MKVRYTLRESLGSGGQGSVIAAFDNELQRPVAIKLLPIEQSETQRSRQEREARAQARVRHPAIVEIFDIVRADLIWRGVAGYALILEFVPGETLAARLLRGPLAPSAAVAIARHLAKALAAIHGKGYLHRDLKPGNVMLTPDGRVKLLDFGLAKRTSEDEESSLSLVGALVGTPLAMSPEQARGEELDARSDLFSLGTLIFHMVTGRAPFAGTTRDDTLHRVMLARVPPLDGELADVPPRLARLVEGLLAKNPGDRPSSAREVSRELARIEAESGFSNAFEATTQSDSEVVVPPFSDDVATPPTLPLERRSSKARYFIPGAVATLTVAAVVIALSHPWGAQALPSVVVLLPQALEGPGKASWHGSAIRELLIAELAAGGMIRVIEDPLVLGALASEDGETDGSLSEARRRWGRKLRAGYLVLGSYQVEAGGSRVRLQLRVVSTSDGTVIDSEAGSFAERELFEAVANAGRTFRSRLGSRLIDARSQLAASKAYPRTVEAARLYGEALLKLSHYDALGARPLLEAAVEVEPDHPLLWAALARTWKRLGYDQKARDAANTAVSRASGLAEPERWRLEVLQAELDRDWTRAISLSRQVMEREPVNLEAGLAFAETLLHAARWQELRDHSQALRRSFREARRDPRLPVLEAEARFRLGERQEAETLLRGVLDEIGSDRSWSLLEARAQQLLGVILLNDKNFEGAKACWSRAQDLYEQAGDRLRLAEIVELMAVDLWDRGEAEEARQLFELARADFERMGNRAAMARVGLNLGNVLWQQGQLGEAEGSFHGALKDFQALGQVQEEAVAWNSLGALSHQRAAWPAARERYGKALSLFISISDSGGAASVLTNLGEVDQMTGDLTSALARHREAAALKRSKGLDRSLAYSLVRLAEVYWAQGDASSALAEIDTARRLSMEERDRLGVARADLLAAEVELARGNLDPAAKLATASEDLLRNQRHASASWAAGLLARIELGSGELREAGHLAERVLDPNRSGGDAFLDLRAEIAARQVQAALDPAIRAEARQHLDRVASRAAELGIPPAAWEARIATAELADTPAERRRAERQLAEVERQARSARFDLLADRALSLLEAAPAPSPPPATRPPARRRAKV